MTNIRIEVDTADKIGFVSQQNSVPPIREIAIINDTSEALTNVRLKLISDPDFITERQWMIDHVGAGETLSILDRNVDIGANYVKDLSESERGYLEFVLEKDEEVAPIENRVQDSRVQNYALILAKTKVEFVLLASDEWGGEAMPELLAAFAMPNDPATDKVLKAASDVLRRAGKEAAIDGYNSGLKSRVYEIVSAIWSAVAGLDLSYVLPPASFEQSGQKIRTPSAILDGRIGTCLDTALLFTAAIEQAGLNPVVVLTEGHAFAGAWLQPQEFAQLTTDEVSAVRTRVDLEELVLFETTLVTANPVPRFRDAVTEARRQISEDREDKFVLAVDIRRARMQKIKPLATYFDTSINQNGDADIRVAEALDEAPTLSAFDTRIEVDQPDEVDRLVLWQRKLLDLTARNRMLNLPARSRSVSLVCPDPGRLEDMLADGKRFTLKTMPDLEIGGRDVEIHRSRTREDLEKEHAMQGLESKEIYSNLDSKKLDVELIKLYRGARSDLNEGGANTLFLSLGFLSWKKNAEDEKSYRAPLILLPITLIRKSVRSGMKIEMHQDEPRFNLTLLELLRQDFEIEIPSLHGELPKDSSGIDVNGIWNMVRHSIKDSPGFYVSPEIVLGIFSFSKYLMWKDLVDRGELLKENAVVKHLLEGSKESFSTPANNDAENPFPNPNGLDDRCDPADLFAPLPADSSQLSAIIASANGHDFVLDGPPGTGKSQTIANMIAQNLAEGRRVLFVAEKRAALDVVYRRLEEVGLGELCLELHSHKSTKTEVLKQLESAWDVRGTLSQQEWDKETRRLRLLRDELNAVVAVLHNRWPNGLTIHNAIGRVARDHDAHMPKFDWDAGLKHNQVQLESMRDIARRLELVFAGLPKTPLNTFGGIDQREWSNGWQGEIVAAAGELKSAVQSLEAAIQKAETASGLMPEVQDAAGAHAFGALLTAMTQTAGQNFAFAFAPDYRDKCDEAKRYAELCQTYWRDRTQLSVTYHDDAEIAVDYGSLTQQWAAAEERYWPMSSLGKRKTIRQLMQSGGTANKPDPEFDLPVLERLSEHRDSLDKLAKKITDVPGFDYLASDPETLNIVAEQAGVLRTAISNMAKSPANLAEWNGKVRGLVVDANDLLQEGSSVFQARQTLENALEGYETAAERFLKAAASDEKFLDFEKLKTACNTIINQQSALNAICQWNTVCAEAQSAGLKLLADHIAENGKARVQVDVLKTFEAAYAKWFGDWAIDAEPLLKQFVSSVHADRIETFRNLTDEIGKLTALYVRARAMQGLPDKDDVARKSGFGILRHELSKQRMHKPVRQLAEEMGTDFTALAPCMLMSPLSIAQYLPPDHELFDLVIFDEASQITPWDAIGSIARGKQLIVAGDPRQMPPTSFFTKGSAAVDIDIDEDLESILEECLTAGLRQHSLDWHYRSRHDSLIAFSNSQYYDNKLVTFPAPETKDSAVHWRRVEGIYAKGKGQTNTIEAEAIVAEVEKRLLSSGSKSIGVVTLNSQQQALIEDLFDKRRSAKPALEEYFGDDCAEPVFVKNLETVQGDERDLIILGIGYGPVEPGAPTMSMNFGPLNREGGWRRLNVAVTRARDEVLLFTSFDPGMIDLNRTSARAVRDLKHYVEFAHRGPKSLAEAHQGSVGETESPLEDMVKGGLEELGWQVHPQIGVSSFRIDLGIVHPDRPGDYLAGVECDGAMYHSAATARDRDKVRQAVLEGLGWSMLRIWSTDVWINAKGAIKRVDDALRTLLEESRAKAEKAKNTNDVVSDEVTQTEVLGDMLVDGKHDEDEAHRAPAVSNNVAAGQFTPKQENMDGIANVGTLFAEQVAPAAKVNLVDEGKTERIYKIASFEDFANKISPDNFHDDHYTEILMELIEHVMSVEAPIRDLVLVQRIARAHDFKRAGSLIRQRIVVLANRNYYCHTESGKLNFYWPTREVQQDPRSYFDDCRRTGDGDNPRSIEDIPAEEIRLAARHLGEVEDIPFAVARQLGIQRLAVSARTRIEAVLLDR